MIGEAELMREKAIVMPRSGAKWGWRLVGTGIAVPWVHDYA